ncbi:MAG: serine hydrolase, partial [Blastocatellia bacterium]
LRVVLGAGSRFSAGPDQQRLMAAKRNYGFEKVERMSGNIGYLDLRGFEPAGAANETATAAMNFLANTDALIFDLRRNGGGSPEMIAFLSSYLFDKRTHLNDMQLAGQLKTLIEGLRKEVGDVAQPAVAQPQPSQPSPAQAATAQEAKLPDTPAGRTLGKFIAAFNTGKLEAMKQFHKESGGDERNAERDMDFYQQSGGLKLHSVVKSSAHEITALVQAKKDDRWLNFSIGVEQQAPHAIIDIRIQPSSGPGEKKEGNQSSATSRPGKLSEAELLKAVNALVDKSVADDSFSGVVMIAKNGKPIFERAVGLADKAQNTPNRVDTKFNLGSINKVFTQTAIQQLVEAGKLSLDDKLGKYLPDYPNPDAREKVTIKHLVNMQSGIGDFFGPKFQAAPKNKIRTINDYLPLFAGEPLKFEPGTSRSYSNGGYIVLGAIIEKVTGGSYYDYVRQHIYKPAGMANTDSYETDAPSRTWPEATRDAATRLAS